MSALRKPDGLRVRLVILLVAAVLPAVGLSAYWAREARQDAVVQAQLETTRLSDGLGHLIGHIIGQADQVLSAVSMAPVVRRGNAAEISDYLSRVDEGNPEFSTLLVTGPDGRVIAAGVPSADHPDLSDRGFWRDVQTTHSFTVGSYALGRVTGDPLLTVAQPILADDGALLGIVGTGIRVTALEALTAELLLSDATSYCVVDRDGTVLLSHPGPAPHVGRPMKEGVFRDLALSGDRGLREVTGPDGVARLYSYEPVPGYEGDVFVAVGIPREAAYATVTGVVTRFLVGMGIVAFLVALAGWIGADFLVLRPIRRLVSAAQRFEGGDLSARAGTAGASGEIGRLARAFDQMVETVQGHTQSLEEAEARYRTLVDSSPDGIVLHQDGRIVFANRAAANLAGASSAMDLVGMSAFDFVHPDYRDAALGRIREALRTGEPTPLSEEIFLRLDGSPLEVEVLGIPVRIGEASAMNTVIHDISDRKRAERAVAESQLRGATAQRMEAVGRLAGGIAHDFNNLLTVVIGSAEMGRTRSSADPDLRAIFDQIRGSADRAAALTRQLLAFSRRQPLAPHVVDLNVLTEATSGLLERLIGEDVRIAMRFGHDLWAVEVDPGQVEQIVTNLLINSRDAMPDGGSLTITTGNVELDEEYARNHPGSHPGPHVMLAVSDTGTGIDPDILPHVFEPFFTTKELGKGTGLGLSSVYGIVKQSGGYIWIYSEPGRGTTVKIYFPRSDKPVDWTPDHRVDHLHSSSGGTETILVVEDEAPVRALAVRILTGAGYTVLQEASPADALRRYEQYSGHIHLLLTDVVLPGMSGKALAESIEPKNGIFPRVLFMSGYTLDAIVHDGRLDPGVEFIEKPFVPDALVRKVREVLDRPIAGQLDLPI